MSTHAARGGLTGPAHGFFRLPGTRLGRVSAGLFAAYLAGMIVFATLDAVLPHGETPGGGAGIYVFATATAVASIVAMVTGALALVRFRERSWTVWVAVVLPALVWTGEVLQIVESLV